MSNIRDTLYKRFDLPSPEPDNELYLEMIIQHRNRNERIIRESGLRERSREMMDAIAAAAGNTTLRLRSRLGTVLKRGFALMGTAAATALLVVMILQPGQKISSDTIAITAWKGNPVITGSDGSVPLRKGIRIGRGSVIKTGATDTMTISEKGTTIHLGSDSELKITSLDLRGNTMNAGLYLASGKTAFRLKKNVYQIFSVSTALGTVRVTGTIFAIRLQDNKLDISVRRGSVLFIKPGSSRSFEIGGNQGLIIMKGKPARIIDTRVNKTLDTLDNLMNSISRPVSPTQETNTRTTSPAVIRQTPPLKKPAPPAFPVSGKQVRLHLSNGSVVRGTIIQSGKDTIRVRTSYSTINVNRSSVKKMETIE